MMPPRIVGSRSWLLVTMLLQAGCGGGYVAQTEPAAPPACQQEANDDPGVRELRMKMAGTSWWRANHQEDLAAVERDALLRCMRRKGLLPPGGVEAVKPLWYDPLF